MLKLVWKHRQVVKFQVYSNHYYRGKNGVRRGETHFYIGIYRNICNASTTVQKGISNREFDTFRLLETYAFAYGLIRSVVRKISNLSIIVCLDHLGI